MESNSFWDMLTSRSKIAGSPRDGDRNVSSLADSSSQDQRKEFESSVFINTCVVKLNLGMTVRATACWLFHKFCSSAGLHDYDEYLAGMTCVFLASKIEERHTKIRDVINVAYRTLYSDKPLLQLDSTYYKLVDSMIDFELFLCRVLKFELNADHPHKYLLHYLESLMGWLNATDAEKNIAEFAWRLLNDCYLTSLCVKHRPDLLALAVCYISLRVHNVKVELEEHAEKPWWKVFIDDVRLEDLTTLGCKILNVYESLSS